MVNALSTLGRFALLCLLSAVLIFVASFIVFQVIFGAGLALGGAGLWYLIESSNDLVRDVLGL